MSKRSLFYLAFLWVFISLFEKVIDCLFFCF